MARPDITPPRLAQPVVGDTDLCHAAHLALEEGTTPDALGTYEKDNLLLMALAIAMVSAADSLAAIAELLRSRSL